MAPLQSITWRPLAGVLVAAATLSACVVVPDRGYYQEQGEVVNVAPPPPQVEYVGPPPALGYIWITGFWAWQQGRHVWTGGHWEAPRRGYRWVPHGWQHEGGGWRLHQGRWDRDDARDQDRGRDRDDARGRDDSRGRR